jgi:hypothetical protein
MIKRILATAAVAVTFGLAGTSPARAVGGCAKWMCGDNGTQLTGVAVQALEARSIELKRVDVVIPKSGKQAPKK